MYQNRSFQFFARLLISGIIVFGGLLAQVQPAGATQFYVRDLFGTVAYTNNDGSINWAGPWVETNDDGTAGGGNVQVIGSELRLNSRIVTNDGDFESIQRPVNLATMLPGRPLLSFTYRAVNLEAADTYRVEVYNGTVWTTLDTFTGNTPNSDPTTRVYDLTAYANANSAIRFALVAGFDVNDESFFVDNVQITYVSASSHTANDVRQTVQTYYIPVPEDQALQAFVAIENGGPGNTPISPVMAYVSISINADDTVIYFDHWEDDFETSITDPTQSTTEVWGDNDLTNGAPPGYASDVLNGGDIIILNNWVPTNHLDWIDFDGGDKIASTEAIAVTRTSWASSSGTLHGGSVEMLDTSVWGVQFDLPINNVTQYDFTYTGVALMASEDGTSIYRNGAFVATLNEGQSYLFNDTAAVGDTFTASAPVQANLLNGNIGSNYASDWLTLYPFDLLGNSYYAVVGPEGAVATAVYLHNPNNSAITVNWATTAGAQAAQNILAHQGVRVTMPTANSGAHFYTTGATPPVFQAISLINSGGQANDWGYTLIPQNQLTQQAMVGWGVGRDPTSATLPAENGSPVWVVAVGSGTMNVCVDYDGDGLGALTDVNGYNYDQLLPLANLARGRVFDSDGDQTGMLLYLCNGSETGNINKIAVAWGQDPATASGGAPGLDVGTSVPPLPNFTAIKGAELVIDLNSNTRFDVRDTFAYNIVIKNTGALPVPAGSIVVSDIIPQYTTYVASSTTFFDGTTTTPITDNTSPNTAFPLDEGGYTINQTLPIDGEFTVSFQVQIDPSLPGLTTIQNDAQVSGLDLEYDPAVEIVVQPPLVTNAIGNRVWIDENGDGLQDPGEPGLPNVTVELSDSTGVTLLDSVVTDLDGGYLFPGLASATYQVRVNATSLPSGLSVSTLGSTGVDFNNQAQPYSVAVGGGENMTADFGYNWAPAANVNNNTGTGAIGDRLWVDADGNGLQDPGEPGLSGVTVRLLTDNNGDGVYGGTGDNPAASTTTNAAGTYIFTGLAAGSYVVEVNTGSAPAGYALTGDPDSACPGMGCDNRTTNPLALAPGDVYLNADFGYQPSGASGTIGNTLWFNPDGDAVVDAGEYGLPGVSVALVRDTNGNGTWDAGEPIIATDITDANGVYSFSGLPLDDGGGDSDADYLVWVNDAENILGELAPNYDADGLTIPASGLQTTGVSAVALSAGSPANNNQDFGYGPADSVNPAEAGVIGDTIFLDRNGNGTFDPSEGLENIEVELRNSSGNALIAYTRTDENGHYFFGGVPDGTYTIRVVQSTLPNGGVGLTNTEDPDTASPGDSQSSVTLAAGSRINLAQDFGYVGGTPGTISGTLWTDTDTDGALDGSEAGRHANVTVALLDSGGDVVATTTTDGSGNYSFPGLPAGTYRVHVTDAENTLNGYWHSVGATPGSDGNSQVDPYTVVLTAGGTNTTADFGYYRAPASLGDFVWNDLDLDGIQDGGETGIPNVVVQLTINWPGGGSTIVTTLTDASGLYRFDNLLLDEDFDGAGSGEPTFSVTFATPTAYLPSPANQGGNDAVDSDGTTVPVTPLEGQNDTSIDSGFYAVVEIGDRIWLDLDGDGVQDAVEPGLSGVIVELSNGVCTVGVDCPTDTTDANGNYNFANLPGGSYTVLVRSSSLPGGVVQTGDPDATLDGQHTLTTTAPNSYLNVDFGYQGTGSISNFVWNDLDGDGVQDGGESGIGGVTVWVDLDNDGLQDPTESSAVSNINGLYTISSLPAGTYTVRATGTPISGATPTFDLDGTSTANVASVTLTAGQNRTDVDWGYQFAALSISKTSSAGGTVNPGDTINYTVIVRNNTLSQQTGIVVTDPLPSGTTYVTESTVVSGYQNFTYLDQFETTALDNSNGTVGWTSTPWTETNDDGVAGTGVIQINGINGAGLARFNSNSTTIVYALTRPANLANAAAATLTYTLREDGNNTAADIVVVRISPDNGASWATLTTQAGNFDTYNGSHNLVSPTDYATANTLIQFRVTGFDGTGIDLNVDNVQIAFSNPITRDNIPGGTNPDLSDGIPASLVLAADNFALSPGQQMQVTYQVTVNNPVVLASIDNTAFVSSAQQPTPQSASVSDTLPPGSVGDFAWRDLDADGVQDGGEPALPGVTVRLYTSGGTLVASRVTDASGAYSFGSVTPGDYYLVFTSPGGYTLTSQDLGGDDSLDSDPNPASGQTATFTVYANTADNTRDAGFLPPPASIGDRVWLDEDSDGVQDAGEAGIPNVTVELQNGVCTPSNDCPTTRTDSEGNYLFTGVTPGSYTVALTSGPAGLAANPTYDEDGIGTPHTSAVTITSGQEHTTADFGYNWASDTDVNNPAAGALGAIGDRVWIDADGDGRQDPGEAGLAGVTVILLTPGGDGIFGTADDTTAATTTDAAGNYIFDGLAVGTYVVGVTAPGGYTQTGDPDATFDNQTTAPILLAPGDVYVNADFGYRPTGGGNTIGNQIFLDSNGDGNLDSGEPGIPGVSVALLDGSGNAIATTLTDGSGQYSFPGLPDGTYTVWVNDTAHVLGELAQNSTPDNANDGGQPCGTCNERNTVTVSGGAGSNFQDFGYAPIGHGTGDGLIGDTIYLDRDSSGTPGTGEGLEGVRVNLYQDSNSDGNYDAGEPLVASTITSENGQYYFGSLPVGNYVVQVDAVTLPAGITNSIDPDGNVANESGLNLSAGEVDLLQDFGYTAGTPNIISGTLWNDTNSDGILTEAGRFAAGVTVALYNTNGSLVATTVTDGSGDYSFPGLPDGTYRVDVTDNANILNGYWHSTGTNPGNDNNSQADPYTIVLAGAGNTTADFGYYRDPAALGDFVWLDRNNNGVQDPSTTGEPGIPGVLVTLSVVYPNNSGSTTFSMLSGVNGAYRFSNLLLDEDHPIGDNTGSTPAYTISFGTPPGATASPTGAGVPGTDSNGTTAIADPIYKGQTDTTYDSGFFTDRLDLGDLPTTYPTYFSPGPAHIIFPDTDSDGLPNNASGVPAVWLGTTLDTEANGQPGVYANLDGADEDGLIFAPQGWTAGDSSTVTITLNSDGSGVTVYFGMWFDWNADGTFDNFYSGSGVSSSPVDVSVPIVVTDTYAANSYVYIRLRADDAPLTSADYQGTLINGEVEDYLRQFSPTAIELTDLQARSVTTPIGLMIVPLLLAALGSLATLSYTRRRK